MTYDSEWHTSMSVAGYQFNRINGITTVTMAAHGLATGRGIRVTRGDGTIAGSIVEDTFSGKFNITRIDANNFSYLQPGLPDAVGVVSGSGVKGFVGLVNTSRDRGFFTWANILMGQPFTLIDNLAVNGWRSDQAETVVDAIIAQNPGWVIAQIPGINDLFGDQSLGGGLRYDSTHVIASLNRSLSKFYAAGIKLILCNLTPPRADNPNNIDAAKVSVYKINRWLKDWATGRRNVWLIDAAKLTMLTDISRPASNLYFAAGGSNTVGSTVTLISDSGPFTANHVGYVAERTNTSGRALITGYVSATRVTAKVQRVFSAFPTSAGAAFGAASWTLQGDNIAKDTLIYPDKIHYSAKGAFTIGSAIAALGLLPPRTPMALTLSDNIMSMGISPTTTDSVGWNVWEFSPFELTGGTVTAPSTGTSPLGFDVQAAPASATCAAVGVASPFGPGEALQLSVTNASGGPIIQTFTMSAGKFTFRVAPGGKYILEIPFSITGDMVAKEFWAEPAFTIDGVTGTTGVMNWNMATIEAEGIPNVWSGMLRSQEFELPAGAVLSNFSVYGKLKLWNNTSTPVVLTVGNTSCLRTA